MKIKIIIFANIITIIICLILSILYFVGNPGGFYLKTDGFLPSFEYTSEMLNYQEIRNASFNGPVTINTTDRDVEVCTYSYASYPKELVMGDYQNLETIKFSVEEINHMSTITIDGNEHSINDGVVNAGESMFDQYYVDSHSFGSVEELANTTFYYLTSNPTQLYTTEFLDSVEDLDAQYELVGFFDISSSDEDGLTINMMQEIEGANLNESITIEVPYQMEPACGTIESNSTYIIDNTGGHYE